MEAVLLHAPGPPEALTPATIADPEPGGAHDVLVRIQAAAVNPIDTKLRARGTFYPERMPAILGCDGAGVVTAVGTAVTRVAVGDPVYFNHGGLGAEPGNYAEYNIVHEDYLARMPAGADFVAAAAAPLVLITAWESLHTCAEVCAGQAVLVHAGAGGVGHVAVQLARISGLRVGAVVRNPDNAAWVRDLGAERVFSETGAALEVAVNDWTAGVGVDAVIDTVGGSVFTDSFALVRPYGDLVTLLQPDAGVDWKEARMRNLRISLELMLTPQLRGLSAERICQRGILEQCTVHIESGELRVHVAETFPLAEAAAAHRRLELGSMRGKLVLKTSNE